MRAHSSARALSAPLSQVVKLLTARGARRDVCQHQRGTILHAACYFGHLGVVQFLVTPDLRVETTSAVDVTCRMHNGATPFFLACTSGNLALVKYLHNHPRVDVSTGTHDGFSPFFTACELGHTEVRCARARALLWCSAHARCVCPPTSHDRRLCHTCCGSCGCGCGCCCCRSRAVPCHQVVKYLASVPGVDVAATCAGQPAWFNACDRGHVDVVKFLIPQLTRAQLEYRLPNGATAVCAASLRGHLATVRCLVEHGASVSQSSNRGETPLHHACQNGHYKVRVCGRLRRCVHESCAR